MLKFKVIQKPCRRNGYKEQTEAILFRLELAESRIKMLNYREQFNADKAEYEIQTIEDNETIYHRVKCSIHQILSIKAKSIEVC